MKLNTLYLLLIVSFIAILGVIGFRDMSYNPPSGVNVTNRGYTTGFRPNTQRDCIVGYTIVITTSPTILAASGGRVTLQTSPDSTTWTTVMTAEQSFPAAVALPGSTGSVTVFGAVKAGQWVRLLTSTIAGSPSFSTPAGTELSF